MPENTPTPMPLTQEDKEALNNELRGRPSTVLRAAIDDLPVDTKVDVTDWGEYRVAHTLANIRSKNKLLKSGKQYKLLRLDGKIYVARIK